MGKLVSMLDFLEIGEKDFLSDSIVFVLIQMDF